MRKLKKNRLKFDDFRIVPNKKNNKNIFLEVISNTKMCNINFCSNKLPSTKILSNLQED